MRVVITAKCITCFTCSLVCSTHENIKVTSQTEMLPLQYCRQEYSVPCFYLLISFCAMLYLVRSRVCCLRRCKVPKLCSGEAVTMRRTLISHYSCGRGWMILHFSIVSVRLFFVNLISLYFFHIL